MPCASASKGTAALDLGEAWQWADAYRPAPPGGLPSKA